MVKDPSFVKEYIGADECKRLTLMNAARSSNYPVFAKVKKYATDEVIEALQKRIKEGGFKPLKKVKKIAQSVGMGAHYDSVYLLLSDDIHTAVRSVKGYVGTDSAGDLDRVEWSPQFDDVPMHLTMAMDVLLRS
jgi:Family of unknown function (DUF5677)